MMKLLRFFRSSYADSMIRWADTTYTEVTRIGRMAPEQTLEDIEAELVVELKQEGWQKLSQKIKTEQKYLPELEDQRTKCKKFIQEATATVLKRAQEGHNINGLYWEQSQEKLQQMISKKEYHKINQQLDWIRTREKIFAKLNPSFELVNQGLKNKT